MEYNPFSYEVHDDPYPIYRWLRDEAPCYHNPEIGFYALSRFDDIWDATLDWETYSSSAGPSIELTQADAEGLSIIAMDPPRHTQIRNIVSRGFTPRRIAAMEAEIRRIARRHLDPLVERKSCDLLKEFAALLPMDVISALLGIPEDAREQVREWADALLQRDPDRPEPPESALRAREQSHAYMREILAKRRAQPRDDLISLIAHAEYVDENERSTQLTDDEVVGFCSLLAAAGNETTTKLIGNGAVVLAEHKSQRDTLWKRPDLIPQAVEEMLRLDAPSQYQGRITLRDVEVHGCIIPRGARVIFVTGAACHDEREFENPDAFDIMRAPERNLYFGYGHHFCIGKSLARLEARIAFEEIAKSFPEFELVDGGLERNHQAHVRGYSSVQITY